MRAISVRSTLCKGFEKHGDMARLVDLRILSTSPLFDEAVGTESLGCLPHPPYRQGAVEKRIRVHLEVAVQHEEE